MRSHGSVRAMEVLLLDLDISDRCKRRSNDSLKCESVEYLIRKEGIPAGRRRHSDP